MSDCERYRNDPDADTAHIESCEECRALAQEIEAIEQNVARLSLETKPDFRRQVSEKLPLAPWEGAPYRSWRLVVTVLVTLFILVSGAFMAAGVAPFYAARTLASRMLPLMSPGELATSFSELIASAPASFHITIGILFVVVNLLLLVLLRRRPRGYDA